MTSKTFKFQASYLYSFISSVLARIFSHDNFFTSGKNSDFRVARLKCTNLVIHTRSLSPVFSSDQVVFKVIDLLPTSDKYVWQMIGKSREACSYNFKDIISSRLPTTTQGISRVTVKSKYRVAWIAMLIFWRLRKPKITKKSYLVCNQRYAVSPSWWSKAPKFSPEHQGLSPI